MSNRILTLVLATTAFANSVQAGLITYEIKADTTGLVPGPGGLIDISLGASTEGAPSVSVQVYDPLTNGTLGGATPLFGTAAGDLKTSSMLRSRRSRRAGNSLRRNSASATCS